MKNIEYINASAGSGKTYTLTHRLVDFLKDNVNGYQPSEVIITTFTKLAAGELREESRKTLLKEHLHDKAVSLDTAAIGTVHSVAQQFIEKYWYLLDISPKNNVISDEDATFYINHSLADIAEEEDIIFFEELLNEFKFAKQPDPDFWNKDLKKVIDKMRVFGIEDLDTSNSKSQNLIDKFFKNNDSFEDGKIKTVLEEYFKMCGDQRKKEKVNNFLNNNCYSNLMSVSQISPAKKEYNQLPEIDEIITKLQKHIRHKDYGSMLKEYVDRIFSIAKRWKEAFATYKKENRLIDYNDMEQMFLILLDNEVVKQEIKDKYKLLLVDEFQDSNMIQIEIFSKLSELVEKSIWVGDPKQSIYGFRGTDTEQIMDINEKFKTGDKDNNLKVGETLGKSYRSRMDLVELSNTVFERSFKNILTKENIVLDSIRKDTEDFKGNAPVAVEHWHLIKENGTTKNDILAQQIAELLRNETLVFDKKTKKSRAIQPEDIAVLVRKNSDCEKIASSLIKLGINVTTSSNDSDLSETAENKLVIAILNYILDSNNELAKAEILYLVDTENFNVEKLIENRLEFLNEPVNKWQQEQSFIKKIDSVKDSIKNLPVRDLVENVIVLLDLKSVVTKWGNKQTRINNLYKLIQAAESYSDRCLKMGIGSSLNNFLVRLTVNSSIETDLIKQKGAINVLTYHKSKGLEWNVVILDSLDNDSLNENKLIRQNYFGVTITPGEKYINLLPWFFGALDNPIQEFKNQITVTDTYESIKSKETEELKRLLYVGVTRARDILVSISYDQSELKWLENIGCNTIEPHSLEENETEADIWGTGKKIPFKRCEYNPDFDTSSKESTYTILKKSESTRDYELRYISPSQTEPNHEVSVILLKDFEQRILTTGRNDSKEKIEDAELGTCLHKFFCIYDYEASENEKLNSVNQILKNHLMQSSFSDPNQIVSSMNSLYSYLIEKYGDPEEIHKEMPIQMKIDNGQIIKGSIDLVLKFDSCTIVIDYKSNQRPKEEILDETSKFYAGKYAGQLEAYCDVLKATGKNVITTLIYYAVSGVLVEVTRIPTEQEKIDMKRKYELLYSQQILMEDFFN